MRLLLFALLALAGCAASAAPPSATDQTRVQRTVEAEVVRDGDAWTVDYRFGEASPAWLFPHGSVTVEGNRPWRPGSWTVETPGVRIERRGRHDVLLAERGDVPEHVRIRFTPFSGDLVAEYDPALVFTDGSVALWSGHFHLYPVASAAAVEALPLDLNGISFGGNGSKVTFRDRHGRVLHIGHRFDSATLIGGKVYVLFGPLQPVSSADISAVIDPQLPEWLKRELSTSTPAIFAAFARALGPHSGPMPMLLASWQGPRPGLTSMGGSTLPGQIGMTFEGIGVVEENRGVRDSARWFIAHEGAHFWLGNTVHYEWAREAWITEGGADLLAVRIMSAIDPDYDPRPQLQAAVNDCSTLAARPIEQAEERSETRAFYACGAVFGLLAEATSGQRFDVWMRALIDANRADQVLNRADWLGALDRASNDPTLSRDIAVLLERGSPDAKAAIASLFSRAGVRFTPGPDGVPRLS
jgi:hypothetical protein